MKDTNFVPDEVMLTAYALGELSEPDKARVEAWLAEHPEAMDEVNAVSDLAGMLSEELRTGADATLSDEQKESLTEAAYGPQAGGRVVFLRRLTVWGSAIAAGFAVWAFLLLPNAERESILEPKAVREETTVRESITAKDDVVETVDSIRSDRLQKTETDERFQDGQTPKKNNYLLNGVASDGQTPSADQSVQAVNPPPQTIAEEAAAEPQAVEKKETSPPPSNEASANPVKIDWTDEVNEMVVAPETREVDQVSPSQKKADLEAAALNELRRQKTILSADRTRETLAPKRLAEAPSPSPRIETPPLPPYKPQPDLDHEGYDLIEDNPFKSVGDDALSTFSIDVDTASYANVRRYLRSNNLPPKDAVRIEELINYFPYNYSAPTNDEPFAVHAEVSQAPWQPEHRLVRIGLKGREYQSNERPPANLVFLIDVSGSMQATNKLDLLKQAFDVMLSRMDARDRIAIVVYAGASGMVLESTKASETFTIRDAIYNLRAGGSTNGAAGIQLAYQTAAANFIKGGINRVVLATDGDFNVGVTSRGELIRMVQEKAKSGVFLTVLGFGMGNIQDGTLEQLADKGNGAYAYIDNLDEAKKVLSHQLLGTLFTIAKDVKIQVEFNPNEVASYRLIGYENRVMAHADFNDDRKDAGEIGAGHTVTALYEVVPKGVTAKGPAVDPLRYQDTARTSGEAESGELLFVKLRYKEPDGDTSKLLSIAVRDSGDSVESAGEDMKHAMAVAAFGMILRESPHVGDFKLQEVIRLASEGLGEDTHGYRAEFLELAAIAKRLTNR